MLYTATSGLFKAYGPRRLEIDTMMSTLPNEQREHHKYRRAKAMCKLLNSYTARAIFAEGEEAAVRTLRCAMQDYLVSYPSLPPCLCVQVTNRAVGR
jgi:hypothetical protein